MSNIVPIMKPEDCLALIKALTEEFQYQPIPPMFGDEYRQQYRESIPAFLKESGNNVDMYDSCGVLVCHGYDRIVIGDYGPFIEFSDAQAAVNNFAVERGQEYRINNPQYSTRCKYEWWTTKSRCGVKLYHQLRTVSYADYKVGMWYVSPFEVFTEPKT